MDVIDPIPARFFTDYIENMHSRMTRSYKYESKIPPDTLLRDIGEMTISQAIGTMFPDRWNIDEYITLDSHQIPLDLNVDERVAIIDYAIKLAQPAIDALKSCRLNSPDLLERMIADCQSFNI